jgi:anti-sigma factor RsiW
MSSVFDNLKDDSSLLLLYVTGEMSASDRQIMEKRLASDAGLRTLLACVQADHETYLQTLAALDAATVPPVPDEAAIQRAGRTVRQWATRRIANPPVTARGDLYLHRWIYPVAVAASLLIAVIVWSVEHNGQHGPSVIVAGPSEEYQVMENPRTIRTSHRRVERPAATGIARRL